MITQKIMTTVVDPIVSALVGNEIFRNSALTSLKNSPMFDHNFESIHFSPTVSLAGAPGIEPGPSVLETDVLAVEHHAPVFGQLKNASNFVLDSS